MLGVVTPNLAELASHIVAISDFWRRSASRGGNDGGVRAIRAMIETWIWPDNSEQVCHAVLRELEALEDVSLGDHEAGLAFKAECILTLLVEEFGQDGHATATAVEAPFGAVQHDAGEQSVAGAQVRCPDEFDAD